MKFFNFIQNEILGMNWLNRLIGNALKAVGIDTNEKIGASVNFFVYDVIKISVLLLSLVFIISYIQSHFSIAKAKKVLGGFKGVWINIISALLGSVTPFCACSSIPLFIGFSGAGLPIGASFSFLISSPMVDLASLILLMSIFGLKVAVAYVIFGLIVAVIGGVLIEKLGMENQLKNLEANLPNINEEEEKLNFKGRIKYSWVRAIETLKYTIVYIVLGVGIGAFIHNWIPQEIIIKTLGGNNPFGVIIGVIIGAPMYADIFATIPIAEALLSKGARLGVVLALMMSVTTLSIPSIVMLNKVIKTKLLATFIAICVMGIICVGYLFNIFQNLLM